MDPPRFVNHYSGLFNTFMRACGLATPWIQKPSSFLPRLPFLIWDTLLVSIVVYMLFIYVYSLNTIHISVQDLCDMGISTASFLYSLLLTLYYGFFGQRLRRITDHMDSIAASIERSELGQAEVHRKMYLKNATFMRFLTVMSFRSSTFLPVVYYLAVPISDYSSGQYRSRFPVKINSPFDHSRPGVYELVFFIISSCVTSSFGKKTVTDCIFVALFRIQADFLKYLSITMTDLQQEFQTADDEAVRKKLLLWIKLHQEVVKNIQELVLVFSPCAIIYYASMILNIVCAAFILIKKDNDSLFQSSCMMIYITVAVTYQFLLSNSADQLTTQARRLGTVTYNVPWYRMKKQDADLVRQVVRTANSPIHVTAYRTAVFLLNRETFAGFIATTLSAFVTLCQMKDLYDV